MNIKPNDELQDAQVFTTKEGYLYKIVRYEWIYNEHAPAYERYTEDIHYRVYVPAFNPFEPPFGNFIDRNKQSYETFNDAIIAMCQFHRKRMK